MTGKGNRHVASTMAVLGLSKSIILEPEPEPEVEFLQLHLPKLVWEKTKTSAFINKHISWLAIVIQEDNDKPPKLMFKISINSA